MTYLFNTTATMKEYNNKKWWIDAGIVRPFTVEAENLKEALEKYREHVKNNNYITISDNALRRKNEMYIDLKDGTARQTGYVITGKTEFQDEQRGGWSTQYIDLWVTINQLLEPKWKEAV